MTVEQVNPTGAEVQQWQDTGLEDMSISDAVIPRIKIIGKEGMWADNLTDTHFPILYFISLGLVRQRVLFHPNVEDGDAPMCKSTDFNTGYPNPEPKNDKHFPWQLSGFNPADFPADASGQMGPLPCSGCQLKEWGSHPTSQSPYCAEQWTMPIYYDSSGQAATTDPSQGFQFEQAEWTPAILTLQKSSLKPIRSYLSSFKAGNKPPFLNICKGTLKIGQRGQVVYSVPTFTKGPESPRDRWEEFSTQYGEMRSFLTRPPVREDDEIDPTASSGPTDNSWGQQQAPVQQAPAPAQPVQPETPVQQAPIQPQAPVQQAPAPAQPQAPAQDPWTGQPVATQQQAPAPVQPQAPVAPAQPVQPQAPAAPAQPAAEAPAQPAQQSAPPAGQELPF